MPCLKRVHEPSVPSENSVRPFLALGSVPRILPASPQATKACAQGCTRVDPRHHLNSLPRHPPYRPRVAEGLVARPSPPRLKLLPNLTGDGRFPIDILL